jgi:DNA-binding NtrC family response regulator
MTDGKARILVVDDEPNIREVLDRGLTRFGYECVNAEATDAAARQLQQVEFDFVVLDLMMPGRSGIDFLPEIMAKQPDDAVLMLTGVADEATAVKAMQGARMIT